MLRCSLNKVRFSIWLQKPSYLHVSMQTEMLIRDSFRCLHLFPLSLHHQRKPNCTATFFAHLKWRNFPSLPVLQSKLEFRQASNTIMQKVIKADSALASYFKSNPKLKFITKFHFCPVPPCTAREHLTQLRGGLLCVLCLLSTDLEPTSILTPLTNFNGEWLHSSFRAQERHP